MTVLDQIRKEIAALEIRLEKLLKAEKAIAPSKSTSRKVLSQHKAARPPTQGKHTSRPAAGRNAKRADAEQPSSVPVAVIQLLKAQGPLPRAEIETAIRADRDLSPQTISVSLQRLKNAGKIKLKNGQWSIKRR